MKGGVEPTSAGYKEWDVVCQALAAGRQHILLRKGGIHEGRKGFSFKHERFYLFPTRFHAQGEQVRKSFGNFAPEGAGEWEEGDEILVQWWCEASWACTLTDWQDVAALEPFHIWTEELVRERYDCGEVQRIHCALVRVFALRVPLKLSYRKKYGGCRTWVDLPFPPPGDPAPVVPHDEFAKVRAEVEQVLGS